MVGVGKGAKDGSFKNSVLGKWSRAISTTTGPKLLPMDISYLFDDPFFYFLAFF